MMRRKVYITAAFCWFLLLHLFGQGTGKAYALALKGMYRNTVQQIKSADLMKMMQRHEQMLLLDARTLNEHKVSHIPGAYHAEYNKLDLKEFKAIPKDTPIVVYCSTGSRGERLGEKLQKAGYRNVYNLYGGIFEWVNQGFPVFDHLGKTTRVHAHSLSWGMWLHEGEKTFHEAA
ncbi:rhodanese-like domain-containing protein [Pontibacter silvestris]|uniref:Rhodanese-like domain-containing protein n=1 Tax=Pontibacter silvestris TaxID=2305183 RepID=A0ABW4WS76_9BACT|nr:rhodanese-like domain-containing protein [Pontibacter silvestris]MCC9137851.1 rhodanese-like domain-containing protein [Pontibacter silvestris]